MGMFTEEPLFDDPNLPDGWYRKVVQRQTGATAGQWDVYVYNPDGKKFRSRNELRSYFNQSSSSLNSEDFDFSVKGKGHHNKGKSPTKKEAESSKENVKAVRKPPTTPVVTVSRRTPVSKPSAPTPERPRRELRKKPTKEEVVEEKPPVEPEEELMDDADDLPEQISNVKLKVKVGYTATGAMIRPATNGRKKKRRFRNMTIKKKPKTADKPLTEVAPPKPNPVKQVAKEVATSGAAAKEEKKETRPATAAKKRSKSASEPVAGPSGLQKVKRSPRRILKRKMAGDVDQSEEDDDDEDLDYVCSLYPTNSTENGKPKTAEPADANEASSASTDESVKDRVSNAKEELNGASSPEAPEAPEPVNGLTDEVGPMNVMAEEHHIHQEDMDQIGDGQMQVVVIGDSVEASHSYAKPHSL